MRGEETQLVGAIRRDERQVLAVLPGTHSKWAIVDNGRLVEFATFMTGELYAVLLGHSILGRMAGSGRRRDGRVRSRACNAARTAQGSRT
jgi:2-dehydro-3-deoxygalactonokinase